MREQDRKAVLTKAIHRYQAKETAVKKIEVKVDGHPVYAVILTPNSDMLLTYTTDAIYPFINRMSVPRFSDWIVTAEAYEMVMEALRPHRLLHPPERNGMDTDKIYSIDDIRAAGKKGELCSIDTEWLITLLKEMSFARSLQEAQKDTPLSVAPIEKEVCTCGLVYGSDDTVSRLLDKNCPKHGISKGVWI